MRARGACCVQRTTHFSWLRLLTVLLLNDDDCFGIDEFVHAKAAVFTTIARVFNAAKGHFRCCNAKAVDKHHASIKVLTSKLGGALDIFRDDATTQAVTAVALMHRKNDKRRRPTP